MGREEATGEAREGMIEAVLVDQEHYVDCA